MQHGTPREFTKESARHSAAKDREIITLGEENDGQNAIIQRLESELAALREDKERLTREIQELKERLGEQ
jgi:predicted  nucleic acid-binding Zn-ribbon protein